MLLLTESNLNAIIIKCVKAFDFTCPRKGDINMKIKSFKMLILFDFYGNILTDKQQELFDLYYNEDMSLSEISENTGITRQAVRDTVVRVEKILLDTEDKLGLVKRYGSLQPQLAQIADNINDIFKINQNHYQNQEIASISQNALSILRNILASDRDSDVNL